ncbi:hypothetical protein PIB30_059183 [Stylosanthes scabra]|uniref:Uncharacterized protein n=1 Tax=Stylosanthes scabra TaxID=79078 RepID=A0ABU6UNR2_9FABA|nr:hypothetical protein [Stylosanthes scabra]
MVGDNCDIPQSEKEQRRGQLPGNRRDKPTIEFDPEIEKTLKKNRSRVKLRELFSSIKKKQIPKKVLLKNLLKKS